MNSHRMLVMHELYLGTPGGWRQHLTPEMNEKVNAWMAKNLAREDLAGLAERFKSTFTYG